MPIAVVGVNATHSASASTHRRTHSIAVEEIGVAVERTALGVRSYWKFFRRTRPCTNVLDARYVRTAEAACRRFEVSDLGVSMFMCEGQLQSASNAL